MKKIVLAVAVIGGITMLSSCKKDYVCSCSGTILGIPYSGADTTLVDMSKKDAEAKCSSFDWTLGTDSQTCELK